MLSIIEILVVFALAIPTACIGVALGRWACKGSAEPVEWRRRRSF